MLPHTFEKIHDLGMPRGKRFGGLDWFQSLFSTHIWGVGFFGGGGCVVITGVGWSVYTMMVFIKGKSTLVGNTCSLAGAVVAFEVNLLVQVEVSWGAGCCVEIISFSLDCLLCDV